MMTVYDSRVDSFIFASSLNTIEGTDGKDQVWAGKEDDRIFGRRGDDDLFGGLGNDVIRGHGGSDLLFGEEGDDRLYGGNGYDGLEGGEGDDILTGGWGGDVFFFAVYSGLEGGARSFGHDVITDFAANGSTRFNWKEDRIIFDIELEGMVAVETRANRTIISVGEKGDDWHSTITLEGVRAPNEWVANIEYGLLY